MQALRSPAWLERDQQRQSRAARCRRRDRALQIDPAPSEILASDNGTFALCFFTFSGSAARYYLALVIGSAANSSSASSAAVVWTANRNNPIQENASLHWNPSTKSLDLADADGNIVWSAPAASNASSTARIELLESGNLAIFNDTGSGIAWQSFDHPSDVILEGQKIYTGQGMTSSKNLSSFQEGNFEIVVEPNGVGFFLKRSMEPYFQWLLWNQGNDRGNTPCPTYETVLELGQTTISMSYQRNRSLLQNGGNFEKFSKCGPDLSSALTGPRGALNLLKLDSSGNLVQMSFDLASSMWRSYPTSVRTQIGACLPLECGEFSVCRGSGQCQCLIQRDSASASSSCPLPIEKPLACDDFEARNHHFLQVDGASYFSIRYTTADRVASSINECSRLCLANCSCRAFFFDSQQSCFFVSAVHGSLTADSSTTAFIKIQNSELVDPNQREKAKAIALGVGGSALFVVLCVGAVAIWLWRRQSSRVAEMLAQALQGSLHRFSYKELQSATNDFSTLLGSGGSGSVYHGVLGDGTDVAIKKLENTSPREFIAEVNSIGSVSHINIVKLCGFCAERSHRMLVYEFLTNGSLDRWLFRDDHEEPKSEINHDHYQPSDANEKPKSVARLLDWKTRYEIALGVARGLAYLHEESRQVIMHLDIKPQNILLDEQFVAKVADFGMSKLLASRDQSQQDATTMVRGTPGYLAPEWLLNCVATKKCDVYSYGMVLLEIIGGRRNLSDREQQGEDLGWYFPALVVRKAMQGQIREVYDRKIEREIEEQEGERMVRLALWCIQENPSLRPAMERVVEILEGREEVAVPPLAFHFALQSCGIISIDTASNSVGFGHQWQSTQMNT